MANKKFNSIKILLYLYRFRLLKILLGFLIQFLTCYEKRSIFGRFFLYLEFKTNGK